jgi:hypothetical protein
MGVPEAAKHFLVRLSLDHSGDMPPKFCAHFDSDIGIETLVHWPWDCSETSLTPDEHVCTSPQTAFIWQLKRVIYNKLRIGSVGIAELYKYIAANIEDMGNACISCGVSHNAKNAQLRRSTPCGILACAQLW